MAGLLYPPDEAGLNVRLTVTRGGSPIAWACGSFLPGCERYYALFIVGTSLLVLCIGLLGLIISGFVLYWLFIVIIAFPRAWPIASNRRLLEAGRTHKKAADEEQRLAHELRKFAPGTTEESPLFESLKAEHWKALKAKKDAHQALVQASQEVIDQEEMKRKRAER